MARDILAGIVASLQPHITANKKKSKNRVSIFKALEKHRDRVYYKRFYQIDEVIGSNKFFRQVDTIVQ